MNSANAQLPLTELVDANTYCNSPNSYNGKTITIKNVIIKCNINSTPTNPNCKLPQGYKFLTIEFPNPRYSGCFVILNSKSNSINSNRDLIRASITFKVDSNINIINNVTQIQ